MNGKVPQHLTPLSPHRDTSEGTVALDCSACPNEKGFMGGEVHSQTSGAQAHTSLQFGFINIEINKPSH